VGTKLGMKLLKQRFVLDTSAFVSNDIRKRGESAPEAVARLLNLISKARLKLNISCYMPPSVIRELDKILHVYRCPKDTFVKLDTWVVKKNPARFEVPIPSEIFYEFITDLRKRMDKGLRVAESAVRKAEKADIKKGVDFRSELDDVITELRDKYRVTLRQGILDSKEDLDVLILAKELEAGIVTADEGIMKWAEELGLRYVEAKAFPDLIEEYLKKIK
jgi:hypothetical protein